MEEKPIGSFNAFLIVLAILALIAVGIFVVSKYYTPREPSRLVYNHFEFKKIQNVWYTQWQKDGQVYDIGLRFNPKEVETVPVSGRLNDTFRRQPFYITFDPEQEEEDYKFLALGVAEIGLNIVRGLGGQIESACTQNVTDACVDRPILTCENDDKAVIYLQLTEGPRVTLDGNCLILQGQELDLIKAVDRVLYHFYNIMPG